MFPTTRRNPHQTLPSAHEKRIHSWKLKHEENLRLREDEGEDSSQFEADADEAYELWLKGTQLGCNSVLVCTLFMFSSALEFMRASSRPFF